MMRLYTYTNAKTYWNLLKPIETHNIKNVQNTYNVVILWLWCLYNVFPSSKPSRQAEFQQVTNCQSVKSIMDNSTVFQ